jgi:hypothetical protein
VPIYGRFFYFFQFFPPNTPNDLRAAHAKVEVALDHNASKVADMRRHLDGAVEGQAQRLAAVERHMREHAQQALREKEAGGYQNATIIVHQAHVGRGSKDGALVAALPGQSSVYLLY